MTALLRNITIIPLSCLLAGCWTPGPGQLDPTLYPWHARNKLAAAASAADPHPHPRIVARGLIASSEDWEPQPGPSQGTFCVMSLEPQGSIGIAAGGGAPATTACSAPANTPPSPAPR